MAGYLGFEATDKKPYIFISYNTEDQARLTKIAKALLKHQINIWYDNGIHKISNEEWQEQIAIHIREAEIVFFFLTQGIFEKKNSFVKKEYDLATRHAKKICMVMLDKINPDIIPAKYDFWWGEIKSKQCIEADGLSESRIADEIYKECCLAGFFESDALQSGEDSASAPQKSGSHTAPVPQQHGSSAPSPGGKKTLPAAMIAVPVVLIAIVGFLAFRSMSGGSSGKQPEAAAAANTASATESDAAQAAAGTTAATQEAQAGTSGITQQKETGEDAVLPEEEAADDTVQEDPYKDVTLPQSLPDEFYLFKDHTYAFYDASRYGFTTYTQVADFCRQQGGHLAVINNAAENTYLFELLRDVSGITAFFGYSDEDEEGEWQWADGDSSYTNWTTYGDWNLPDNGEEWGGDEDYAEFNYERGKPGIPSDGTWNDAPFMDNTTHFICEWDFDVKKAQEAHSSQ